MAPVQLQTQAPVDLADADAVIDSYGADKSWLVMILQDIQEAYNYLPQPVLEHVASRLGLATSHVYRVATFYASFSLKPRGQHIIRVCDGTACHLRGGGTLLDQIRRTLAIDEDETTTDGLFTLEVVACLGACALAPVMMVDGEYHGQMTPEKVRETLAYYRTPADQRAPADVAPTVAVLPSGSRFAGPDDLGKYRQTLTRSRAIDAPAVLVCGGTGCRAGRGLAVAKAFEQALRAKGLHEKVSVKTTGCHGFCEQGPLVVLLPSRTLYTRVTVEDVSELVATSIEGSGVVERLAYRDPVTKKRIVREHELPFYAEQQRQVFAASGRVDPTNIDDYIAAGGYASLAKALAAMPPEEIITAVERSGLRGRGGGGFPTGKKWRSCREAHGEPKYLLCNGDEGDPGAFMDRSIMEGNPHSVLEGMAIGAYAIGCSLGYIYVRLEYPLAVENLRIAIAQAEARGLLGKNILGSGFDFSVRISRGAGAFVCGESTALMASIEGQAGEPRAKHIHTSEKGVFGKPTT
ncbi:MAG: NAD(P)H-dependent oxidoreductase subunit E, partial [Planctomycetota bacterium]